MTATATDHGIHVEMPDAELYDITSMGEGLSAPKRETWELTPEHALEFLDYPEFIIDEVKVDRNRSNEHIIYLTREMLKGSFLWEQVNLVLCKVAGNSKPTRLNGNHTAWARLAADEEGLSNKTRCPVQLLHYQAKTVEDMRRLYASLDRGKPRNQGNVVNSYLAGTEEFPDYSSGTLRSLAQGLGQWLWTTRGERQLHGGDDRSYLLLKDHHKVALVVGQILKESKPKDIKHIRRAPVIGAMFATCNKAPQIASEFWRDVRDGLNIGDKDDPRYVLRNWLMQTSLAKSQYNGDLKTVSQEEAYRACIYKWNEFRKGRKARAVRIDLSLERPEAQ